MPGLLRARELGDPHARRACASMGDVMAVRDDCRHYSTRTLPTGDQVERCRLDVAQKVPFACPDDCPFFEKRSISSAGWQVKPREDEDL